jgi:hypothetical protein
MCAVCKTDEKCEHPWNQCAAGRGEHCDVCGHDSRAPLRRPEPREPEKR